MAELVEFDSAINQDVYVNVYLVDQLYGGPEEGGWWYDTGEPVESICVPAQSTSGLTREAAEKLRQSKQVYYDSLNKDRRPKHSVLSDGVYEVCLEDRFAEPYPETRPYYE